eukprot:CAMPEP_0176437112 /NCGR_PEP_ID=MMETSP0127-20121128/18411_1 /TAXON_ID=938130 /ORGANISM="Platyophrya macrostoma, Strain WH" /LENGTH=118 /DNA_ID=CAMNT_0017820643 /DNA_START=54 /DNA_END=410 /DNA_ORIENTATION=-
MLPMRLMSTRAASAASMLTPSSSSLRCSRRHINTDKVVVGAVAATCTSVTTIGVFHLIVTPVSLTIGVSTVAAAAASGALAAIEGDKEGGSSFGAVCGIFFGAIGGYYAKSSKEPWRK